LLGATLFALDEVEDLYWASLEDMEDFLDAKTITVAKADIKEGDILVLYGEECCRYGVIHTALYLGEGIFWHKIGDMETADNTFCEVLYIYADFDEYAFKRIENI